MRKKVLCLLFGLSLFFCFLIFVAIGEIDSELFGYMVFSEAFGDEERDIFLQSRVDVAMSSEFVRSDEYWENFCVARSVIDAYRFGIGMGGDGCFVFYGGYVGHFIDGYGNLVVNVVCYDLDIFEPGSPIYPLLRNENVQIRLVRYSYSEFRDAIGYIGRFIASNPNHEVRHGIDSFGIDIVSNRVVVSMYLYNDEMIAMFREEVLDSSVVVFRRALGRTVRAVDAGVVTHGWDLWGGR